MLLYLTETFCPTAEWALGVVAEACTSRGAGEGRGAGACGTASTAADRSDTAAEARSCDTTRTGAEPQAPAAQPTTVAPPLAPAPETPGMAPPAPERVPEMSAARQSDPLAALNALSYEEKIALFT
jgi:hypothetical protein